MQNSLKSEIEQYLAKKDICIEWGKGDIPMCSIPMFTKGMQANNYFLGHQKWGKEYFENSHRSETFKARWRAAIGNWENKIVVDIGCGPGNIYASLGGSPKIIIGVDISHGALEFARNIGYTPILVDAHHLPFNDKFAEVVDEGCNCTSL
ncbi:MAG: methyltransferase domain-containing protein [Rhizonema sp. PD37]|nr:methyltransferase domain-containing protein [Rhizonema sp. PD37]